MYIMQCFVELTCIITSCRTDVFKKYGLKNRLGFIKKNVIVFNFDLALQN